MPKTKETKLQYEHGELLKSIVVKVLFLAEKQAFLIDDQGDTFQSVDIDDLEVNKTFEITNVVIEKRNNFAYKFCLFETKETKVTKLKKNLKKQYKKTFELFQEAQPGKVTNLKCMIVAREDDGKTLKLFDGTFFKLKFRDELGAQFNSNKLEIMFVRKSNAYNFIWKTGLTQINEADQSDEYWDDVKVPTIENFENPEEIPDNQVGKWIAMLTTATPPFTYSSNTFSLTVLDAAPNSPKKVKRLDDGTFKNEKSGEVFQQCKKEIRLSMKASNGEQTISCVCFTKIASLILGIDANEFTTMDDAEQRLKVKHILYEKKILTLRKQGDNYLLVNVEKGESSS